MCIDNASRFIRFPIVWTRLLIATAILAFGASAHAGEKITYHHFDALGSPVAATNEQGNVIWRETYQPYGERIQKSPAAAGNTRWHTGHVLDPETGLQYAGARYYDPVLGRFMGIDPQGYSPENLHSFNRYAYGNNNPYKYVDPDGASPLSIPDWYDFSTDVGSLLVNEIIYGSAKILGNEGTAQIALEAMSAGVGDAAASTAGMVNPVPGTGRVIKGVQALKSSGVVTASKAGSAGGPGTGKVFSEKTKDAARTGECVLCEKPTTRTPGPDQSNIDHAIPKSRGGNNTLNNAQETCRTCNLKKGTKTTNEYLRSRK